MCFLGGNEEAKMVSLELNICLREPLNSIFIILFSKKIKQYIKS